ncbi:Gfo/Idh/MocA family oxidoreductase [Anaerolineae bacterium CFX9]|nr:Gfo/Idh/MocA family oxidoreductase [Anaerolineae bacterium CFX9]
MTEQRVRWGLLGTARINERLIASIRSSARSELVAVASRTSLKADAYAEFWNIPAAHGSYEGLLADPDVDAIYISLPNGLHEEWSIRCAEAGKHVLCEKPLALTVEEVDRMTEAADRCGVIIQEAVMYRFHHQTFSIQQMIASGVIGKVRMMRAAFSYILTNKNDVRFDPDMGGGSLWDLGSYPVSFFRTMLGANPVEVSGWQHTTDRGVDLTFMGQMRFPNGEFAQFGCSFEASPHTEVELLGTEGRINLTLPWRNRPGETGLVHVTREGADSKGSTFGDNVADFVTETLVYDDTPYDSYQAEVVSMEASILDGAPPIVPLQDSRGTVEAVVALYESARINRPVSIPSS